MHAPRPPKLHSEAKGASSQSREIVVGSSQKSVLLRQRGITDLFVDGYSDCTVWTNARKDALAFICGAVYLPSLQWKGARVVELARLESVCTGNGTAGSNPALSAIPMCGLRW